MSMIKRYLEENNLFDGEAYDAARIQHDMDSDYADWLAERSKAEAVAFDSFPELDKDGCIVYE